MIFFNIKEVRQHLIDKGHVYTLRRFRSRTGHDLAAYGSIRKSTVIGHVQIFLVGRIDTPEELTLFIKESGLYGILTEEQWLNKARELHGTIYLYLYQVIMEKK